ncbi:MAG: hypothetical protein GX915_01125 [Clostridiales bacterium]|nr:hypothetical protein [Clostridiales bacterium]
MVDNIINVEQNATGQLAGLIREFGDTIPIGVLYQEEAPNFHQRNPILSKGSPLYKR